MTSPTRPESERNDVFDVLQVARGTELEDIVGADVVGVEPHSTSQIHRHNLAETVLFILAGSGTVRVGEQDVPVREGDRVLIPKGTYHGVRTGAETLRFLSVQSPPILNRARDTLDLEPLAEE
ncbi:MAG: cupin domain-containing protein [Dehalococcoidia bacterium]|nr:cupin domain-containing protein [Dehalococcoidia bacterium]